MALAETFTARRTGPVPVAALREHGQRPAYSGRAWKTSSPGWTRSRP